MKMWMKGVLVAVALLGGVLLVAAGSCGTMASYSGPIKTLD